ncbi:hypothetical protein KCP70_10865 [Salmonella enterica subsp. enterica]|nr:hypothetical protein KCP70_10865 [Salmonella enterica subsp. enterica]
MKLDERQILMSGADICEVSDDIYMDIRFDHITDFLTNVLREFHPDRRLKREARS